MRTHSVKLGIAIKKISQFHREQRRMPTYEEIAKLFKFASKRSGYVLIQRLIQAGFIDKDSKGHFTLKRACLPLPSLGSTKAVSRDAEREQLIDIASFDDYLVERPESSYLLRVSGDSMIGAHIQENDIIIVDKKKEPKVGDIVAAFIDNELTLKYLLNSNGKFCLVAANKKYPIIYPKDNVSIEGVVTSVLRKYG